MRRFSRPAVVRFTPADDAHVARGAPKPILASPAAARIVGALASSTSGSRTHPHRGLIPSYTLRPHGDGRRRRFTPGGSRPVDRHHDTADAANVGVACRPTRSAVRAPRGSRLRLRCGPRNDRLPTRCGHQSALTSGNILRRVPDSGHRRRRFVGSRRVISYWTREVGKMSH